MIGLLGATSFVGHRLISRLLDRGHHLIAFYRKPSAHKNQKNLTWCDVNAHFSTDSIPTWLCVAPIWVIAQHFPRMMAAGVRRVIALSSTSRFTKLDSSDAGDNAMAARLAEGEKQLETWATQHNIEWIILRPTLIYGYGRDKNITAIAQFIQRFRCFIVCGKAMGLRQPIHVDDVENACLSAMEIPNVTHHAYNISGGETLPYREMVRRIFAALHCRPRFIQLPLLFFKLATLGLHFIPRYRHYSWVALAERMNRDLVFDHTDAARDLGFSPRPFQPSIEDLS